MYESLCVVWSNKIYHRIPLVIADWVLRLLVWIVTLIVFPLVVFGVIIGLPVYCRAEGTADDTGLPYGW